MRLHWPVDGMEVGAVALMGWLSGTLIVSMCLGPYGLWGIGLSYEAILASPVVFVGLLFGVGLASLPWALPTGFFVAFFLRLFSASRNIAVGTGILVGCAYAVGLSRLPVEWQWWSDFWWVALLFGASLGIIYARVIDTDD